MSFLRSITAGAVGGRITLMITSKGNVRVRSNCAFNCVTWDARRAKGIIVATGREAVPWAIDDVVAAFGQTLLIDRRYVHVGLPIPHSLFPVLDWEEPGVIVKDVASFVLIEGHDRVARAKHLGESTFPVHVLSNAESDWCLGASTRDELQRLHETSLRAAG